MSTYCGPLPAQSVRLYIIILPEAIICEAFPIDFLVAFEKAVELPVRDLRDGRAGDGHDLERGTDCLSSR